MAAFSYYANGKPIRFNVVAQAGAMASAAGAAAVGKRMSSVRTALHANAKRFGDLFAPRHEPAETMVVLQKSPDVTMLATESLTVEGATKAELKVLKDKYGMEVVREGQFGKVLLRNTDEAGQEAVKKVFECARAVYKRGNVD